MFYVGTYSTFAANSVKETKVKDVEKLGHSRGRANRYLDEHKQKKILVPAFGTDGKPTGNLNEVTYRAVVFVMPERFRLSNDVIKLAIKQFKCDWQTAKFHCYRTACVDVVGHAPDWPELFAKPEEKAVIEASEALPSVPTEPEAVAT